MSIRQANIDDAPVISRLIYPLAEKYIAPEFSDEGAKNLLASVSPESIERYFRDGYDYHVAEEDGVVAGVIGVRDNCHLYHLFVADEFRGRGLARQLWQMALAVCLESGSVGAITVNSSCFAVPMYEKLGFVRTGPAETWSGVTSVPMQRLADS